MHGLSVSPYHRLLLDLLSATSFYERKLQPLCIFEHSCHLVESYRFFFFFFISFAILLIWASIVSWIDGVFLILV